MKPVRYVYLILTACVVGVVPLRAALPDKAHCQICWIREGAGEEPVVAWSEYQGRMFYFCSEGCKAEFEQDPGLWSIDPVATKDTAGFVTSVPT